MTATTIAPPRAERRKFKNVADAEIIDVEPSGILGKIKAFFRRIMRRAKIVTNKTSQVTRRYWMSLPRPVRIVAASLGIAFAFVAALIVFLTIDMIVWMMGPIWYLSFYMAILIGAVAYLLIEGGY